MYQYIGRPTCAPLMLSQHISGKFKLIAMICIELAETLDIACNHVGEPDTEMSGSLLPYAALIENTHCHLA